MISGSAPAGVSCWTRAFGVVLALSRYAGGGVVTSSATAAGATPDCCFSVIAGAAIKDHAKLFS